MAILMLFFHEVICLLKRYSMYKTWRCVFMNQLDKKFRHDRSEIPTDLGLRYKNKRSLRYQRYKLPTITSTVSRGPAKACLRFLVVSCCSPNRIGPAWLTRANMDGPRSPRSQRGQRPHEPQAEFDWHIAEVRDLATQKPRFHSARRFIRKAARSRNLCRCRQARCS